MVLTLMLGQGLCRLRRVQFDPALFLRQFHQLSGDELREVEGGGWIGAGDVAVVGLACFLWYILELYKDTAGVFHGRDL